MASFYGITKYFGKSFLRVSGLRAHYDSWKGFQGRLKGFLFLTKPSEGFDS